jgi:20S proteasome alpha/beta subunit
MSVDLSTTYLGMKLRNPVVIAADSRAFERVNYMPAISSLTSETV